MEVVMAKRTAADQFVEILLAAGVRRMYGVVGDSLNPVVDAIRRHDGIDWVHVRHEEAGAFAAGAEAQLTGRLVACAGSCGPGNLHLINGLYDAHRSMVPVLALAAQIPSTERNTLCIAIANTSRTPRPPETRAAPRTPMTTCQNRTAVTRKLACSRRWRNWLSRAAS